MRGSINKIASTTNSPTATNKLTFLVELFHIVWVQVTTVAVNELDSIRPSFKYHAIDHMLLIVRDSIQGHSWLPVTLSSDHSSLVLVPSVPSYSALKVAQRSIQSDEPPSFLVYFKALFQIFRIQTFGLFNHSLGSLYRCIRDAKFRRYPCTDKPSLAQRTPRKQRDNAGFIIGYGCHQQNRPTA